MTGTNRYLERIELQLKDRNTSDLMTLSIDLFDNSLTRRWLPQLVSVIERNLHLEKNYCFLGWPDSARNGDLICQEINRSIAAINSAGIGYAIDDHFDMQSCVFAGPVGSGLPGRKINRHKFNQLHRYFEDLQGVSGAISKFYLDANAITRWHIRQLNLLCHEFESWALSWRKSVQDPEWCRPSQLMCWLQAPRFSLTDEDHEQFGLHRIERELGGVYLGVNKAIGKHHWEVFQDEGRDSRLDELTTTSLRSQTEAAADFDIEWGRDTVGRDWMTKQIAEFQHWLECNGFNAHDPALTIGHPKIAQVDLDRSFATRDPEKIWQQLAHHLDVYSISVAGCRAIYDYHWSDDNYMHQQLISLGGH